MSDDFNWLDEEEAAAAETSGGRSRMSRLIPGFLRRGGGSASEQTGAQVNAEARPSLWRRILGFFPGLLRRFRRGGGEESAADLALQRGERPIEELDDRLRALRERASARPQQTDPDDRQALYDVDEVLVTPEIMQRPGGVISPLALSKAQQEQVALLRDMVGTKDPEAETEAPRRRIAATGRAFTLAGAPTVIGSALILLAVALPFVSSGYRQGDLPPTEFHEDRHGATTAFNMLDNLTRDDTVLVAFEYGPTAAGELDAMADIILRHIMVQGATPIIVSSNPVAMAHARNVIARIGRSVAAASIAFEENRDYYLLRYLSGGALGLRDLSRNFESVIRFSATGKATGLALDSLDDLTLMVVIAERADAIRNWAEQVAPETTTDLVAATGYAAQPLSQPYVDLSNHVVGLIVGARDVYTYGEKLQANYEGYVRPTATPTPTTVASPTPTAAASPTPTIEPSATPTVVPTATLEEEPELEQISVAVDIVDAETETATATPVVVVAPPPSATPELVQVIEVTAAGLVNIRRGPNTTTDILGIAQAGDIYRYLGANDDGSWINFLLPDGIEAWIAAFLVAQYEMPLEEFRAVDSASAARPQTVLQTMFAVRLGKNPPRIYQVDPPGSPERPEIVLLRDRRSEVAQLDAMTLGTIAAVLVIAFGNIFYAMRGLLERRRQDEGS